MVLSTLVLAKVMFLLEKLCALNTVVDSICGSVLIRDQGFELCELFRVAKVSMDLVDGAMWRIRTFANMQLRGK